MWRGDVGAVAVEARRRGLSAMARRAAMEAAAPPAPPSMGEVSMRVLSAKALPAAGAAAAPFPAAAAVVAAAAGRPLRRTWTAA